MNKLTVSILDSQTEWGKSYTSVELQVDGVRLIDLVERVEAPMAEAEGHPTLAGAYAWLPASPSIRQELSSTTTEQDKVALLECSCGVPGCWPLLAQVEFNESTVTWSKFEQPHRGEDAVAGHWNYEHFGPFLFQREEYEQELAKI